MARRYAGRGEEVDDLVQAGSVGLVKASTRFDPSRGVAFATFVAPAVEGEIRRHLRERSPGVRLPRGMQRMSTELRRTRDELAGSLGREPDVAEVAAALDADVSEVERLMAADRARITVPLPGAPDADVEDSDAVAESEYRVLLEGGLKALDDRERRIVFLRFHADMTEAQIARAVGISQAHVSRLLEGALTKLRNELDGRDTTKSPAISRPETQETAASDRKIGEVGVDSPEKKTGYSGRFLVRMPSELHEQLALKAERQQVSLNRYVTDTLSSSVGLNGSNAQARTEPSSKGVRPRTLRMALATNLAVVVVAGVIAVVLLVLALQRGI